MPEVSPAVAKRQKIEKKIVNALIDNALAAGYAIIVDNGEERSIQFTDKGKIVEAMFATDEEHLLLRKDGITRMVFLVYGNDGWDVINDYSVSLEHIIPNDLIDKLSV